MNNLEINAVKKYGRAVLNKTFSCDNCGTEFKAGQSNAHYQTSFCSSKCENEYTKHWK